MLFTIGIQFRLFIFSLLAGVITGVLFDLYRLFRGFENPSRILTFIEDVLFWIFTAIIVFIFLAYTKSTYLSGYAYMFIGIGILLYLKLLSKMFITIEFNLVSIVAKAIRVILKLLIYPISLLLYRFKRKNKRVS